MARLGLFGGSFDPPHLGHLILASEAYFQCSLDRVLWIITQQPPHKSRHPTQVEDRLAMVEAAIAGNTAFRISRLEVDRPGPHFTLDTLKLLRASNPDDQLVYLMGGDSLSTLPAWHRPQDVIAACDEIGVMRRPGDSIDLSGLEVTVPGLASKVTFIDAPLLEISSRELRRRVGADEPVKYYLPQAVIDLIKAKGLYRLDSTG